MNLIPIGGDPQIFTSEKKKWTSGSFASLPGLPVSPSSASVKSFSVARNNTDPTPVAKGFLPSSIQTRANTSSSPGLPASSMLTYSEMKDSRMKEADERLAKLAEIQKRRQERTAVLLGSTIDEEDTPRLVKEESSSSKRKRCDVKPSEELPVAAAAAETVDGNDDWENAYES